MAEAKKNTVTVKVAVPNAVSDGEGGHFPKGKIIEVHPEAAESLKAKKLVS